MRVGGAPPKPSADPPTRAAPRPAPAGAPPSGGIDAHPPSARRAAPARRLRPTGRMWSGYGATHVAPHAGAPASSRVPATRRRWLASGARWLAQGRPLGLRGRLPAAREPLASTAPALPVHAHRARAQAAGWEPRRVGAKSGGGGAGLRPTGADHVPPRGRAVSAPAGVGCGRGAAPRAGPEPPAPLRGGAVDGGTGFAAGHGRARGPRRLGLAHGAGDPWPSRRPVGGTPGCRTHAGDAR